MSRIGRMPIVIPKGVEIKVDGQQVSIKGPKGTLKRLLEEIVELKVEDGQVLLLLRPGFEKEGNKHGLARALVANMMLGVTQGFQKKLNLVGVGYRAAVKGKNLDFQLGLSHPLALPIPEGLTVQVEANTEVTITGTDVQAVGQFAADVRALKKPEPYKGKGIMYKGEYIRRKAGKAAAAKTK